MVQTDRPTPPGDASDPALPTGPPLFANLFPPRDADEETYRRWLVTSPWPEVVFASASAGAR